jgi:hypothetical protein
MGKDTVMKARCKFKLTKVESYNPKESLQLRFQAHYDEKLIDDQSFSKATPSGTLDCVITNPTVLPMFELGKQYYVEITPVE